MSDNKKNILRFVVVIVVPVVGVIGMLPIINRLNTTLFGMPLIYAWMFLWFVLTSLCLLLSWYCFDRDTDE